MERLMYGLYKTYVMNQERYNALILNAVRSIEGEKENLII